MSLAERLKSTGKMEVDPPQGKRQSETAQQGSPPKRRPEDPSAKTDEGRRTPKGRGRGRDKSASGGQEAGELMRAMSALALDMRTQSTPCKRIFIVYLDTPGKTAASAIPAPVQTQREHKQTSEGIPLLLALFSQLESQIQSGGGQRSDQAFMMDYSSRRAPPRCISCIKRGMPRLPSRFQTIPSSQSRPRRSYKF